MGENRTVVRVVRDDRRCVKGEFNSPLAHQWQMAEYRQMPTTPDNLVTQAVTQAIGGRSMTTRAKPVQLANGTVKWRVRFRLSPGTNPVSETFADQDEANRFARLVDIAGGAAARKARNAATTATGDSLEKCFNNYVQRAESHITGGTADKYRRMWRRYIGPDFGAWPADALTTEQVELWIARLRKTETIKSKAARDKARKLRKKDKTVPLPRPDYLSGKTIANIQGLLSTVLDKEVKAGRLARNPARGVALPETGHKREPVFLTPSEFAVLYQAIPEKWRPLIATIAGTGMRWGEVTALRVENVDLDADIPVIHVVKAWKRQGKGEGYDFGTTKSRAGVRTVSISPELVNVLRPIVEGAPKRRWLFEGPRGGRVKDAWFYEHVWNDARDAADLGGKRPTLHSLRHSHASWLIAQGVPLTVIQRRLGHESIKITSDTYGHLALDAWTQAAAATSRALSQALPEIAS